MDRDQRARGEEIRAGRSRTLGMAARAHALAGVSAFLNTSGVRLALLSKEEAFTSTFGLIHVIHLWGFFQTPPFTAADVF